MKGSYFITTLLITASLIGTAMMQIHLKAAPQIGMMVFGTITLLSFFTKQKTTTTVLFYILIGITLFINYFMMTDWLIEIINPDRGWATGDEKKHRVMDMSWIWCLLIGIILAPLTLRLYHKTKYRKKSTEMVITSIFLITTIIIYIKHELL